QSLVTTGSQSDCSAHNEHEVRWRCLATAHAWLLSAASSKSCASDQKSDGNIAHCCWKLHWNSINRSQSGYKHKARFDPQKAKGKQRKYLICMSRLTPSERKTTQVRAL